MHWSKGAAPDKDLLEVGEQRYENQDTSFGFQNSRRLYERSGFVEKDRAAIVPYPLIRMEDDALLMIRSLDPADGR